MNPKILTVGSCYFSVGLEIPAVPPTGGVTKIKNYVRYPDGSGVNTAVALAKLEADPILVTSVGNDSNGKMIMNFLSSHISVTESIHVEKGVSAGTVFRLLDVDGGKRQLVYEGANSFLTTEMVEEAFNACPDGVIVNGDMPQEIVYTAILAANSHQIPVLVDLRGRTAARLPVDQFGGGTILVMDQANAKRYCGMKVETVEDCLRACISLAGKVKSRYFVIRLEGKGAFAYNGKYYYFVPNYDFIPADERGGEEYYNAALLLRYLLEKDIRISCEFAALAETVAMLKSGGANNLPGYEDIRKFVLENELDRKLLIE